MGQLQLKASSVPVLSVPAQYHAKGQPNTRQAAFPTIQLILPDRSPFQAAHPTRQFPFPLLRLRSRSGSEAHRGFRLVMALPLRDPLEAPPKKVERPWLQTDVGPFRMVPFSELCREPMSAPPSSAVASATEEATPPRRGRRRGAQARDPAPQEPAKLIEPDAPHTEEDWLRRLQHRTEGVMAVTRTNQYRIIVDSGEPRPQTPDPTSREPKRSWEKSMQAWRAELDLIRPRA